MSLAKSVFSFTESGITGVITCQISHCSIEMTLMSLYNENYDFQRQKCLGPPVMAPNSSHINEILQIDLTEKKNFCSKTVSNGLTYVLIICLACGNYL